MKLLLDQNLSPRLAGRLASLFPGTVHVGDLGLDRADDLEVWQHAGEHGFAIVTKDADFNELLAVRGSPPKVIWIRRGNCATSAIEEILTAHRPAIANLEQSNKIGLLMLF